jgi:death-on-curing protein
MIDYLTEQDVLDLHDALVVDFGDGEDPIEPPGPRDLNLVGSAVMRPHTSLGGVEKYHGVQSKGAALFHSLAKNHGFHNGNKRTALLAMLSFLERNGYRLNSEVNDDEVFDIVVGVADGSWPRVGVTADDTVDALATWLSDHSTTRKAKISAMRSSDFLDKCVQAGCRVSDAGSSWRVQGTSGSVSFSKSTSELTGNVVKAYLRKLGLLREGVSADAFQDGLGNDVDLLLRFRSVLKRLAHT